jgi:hypothetical protein
MEVRQELKVLPKTLYNAIILPPQKGGIFHGSLPNLKVADQPQT